MISIVVALRDKYPLRYKSDFIIVNISQINTSSSRLRDMVSEGLSIKDFVNSKVADYIEDHRLYR